LLDVDDHLDHLRRSAREVRLGIGSVPAVVQAFEVKGFPAEVGVSDVNTEEQQGWLQAEVVVPNIVHTVSRGFGRWEAGEDDLLGLGDHTGNILVLGVNPERVWGGFVLERERESLDMYS
jgi:hypothetical protein